MVKMGIDMSIPAGQKMNAAASANFDLLVDVEVLLSLSCFVPMLNCVHNLIKLSQPRMYSFVTSYSLSKSAKLTLHGCS